MRVTPDAQLFTALSRESGMSARTGDRALFARQSAITAAYDRRAEPVRAPSATAKTVQKEARRTESHGEQNDAPANRREAPMGTRPRFQPKGQSVNLLV